MNWRRLLIVSSYRSTQPPTWERKTPRQFVHFKVNSKMGLEGLLPPAVPLVLLSLDYFGMFFFHKWLCSSYTFSTIEFCSFFNSILRGRWTALPGWSALIAGRSFLWHRVQLLDGFCAPAGNVLLLLLLLFVNWLLATILKADYWKSITTQGLKAKKKSDITILQS